MTWRSAFVLGCALLAGCATEPPTPVSSDEHQAAICLRDALAASPTISNVREEEWPSIYDRHALVASVEFDIADTEGKTRHGELLAFREVRTSGTPSLYFSNWALLYFSKETGIDRLLAERCPQVPDHTPIL